MDSGSKSQKALAKSKVLGLERGRSQFFSLRDLSGRVIPGLPSVVELPAGGHPSNYKDGVYIIGELFCEAKDVEALDPEERASLLRHPHMLCYGHRQEMRVAENKVQIRKWAKALIWTLLIAQPVMAWLAES